jgi:hypothetical protein
MKFLSEHFIIICMLLYIIYLTVIKTDNPIDTYDNEIEQPQINKINTVIIDPPTNIDNDIDMEIEDNKMPIIPKIQKPVIKSSCVMPNKEMAKCIADTIIKTNCVKCSLENCDKNHLLSTSCYENEKHSHHRPIGDMNRPIGDMNRSCGDMNHPLKDMTSSCGDINRSCGDMNRSCGDMNRPCGDMNNIMDYYSSNNLHEYNSIDNLNQENTHIIYKGMYGNSFY